MNVRCKFTTFFENIVKWHNFRKIRRLNTAEADSVIR